MTTPAPNPNPNPNPTPAPAPAPAPASSVLGGGAAPAPAAGGGAPGPNDWLPEKYRVSKEDKSLDLEASARKLADGYGELARRLGSTEAPPKSPEEYEAKDLPHGLSFDELKKDPKMQNWLKGAHAKGMSNAQIQHVLTGFAEYLGGDQALTADEATAELRKVWSEDVDFRKNQAQAYRAASAVARQIGVEFADLEAAGLGNNPLFVRIMAAVGSQMREDAAPSNPGTPAGAGDWQKQVDELQNQLDQLAPHDTRRKALLERKNQLYEAKYGRKPAGAFRSFG